MLMLGSCRLCSVVPISFVFGVFVFVVHSRRREAGLSADSTLVQGLQRHGPILLPRPGRVDS